ncbi:protein COFACTOR ASSEMBLY OF COMPLEX C SUBUNIT B CCB2, chloroplastic isoform X2 [Curcuma longa]|uniref:protein COFACTOR ASSEMBLY OF COMPLEX C SUBUNIT B CCB2, chloroplastic isoform X2 n=1 Tax=Curcuma longa TaxID=136217 RepID=UPI003D9EDD0D
MQCVRRRRRETVLYPFASFSSEERPTSFPPPSSIHWSPCPPPLPLHSRCPGLQSPAAAAAAAARDQHLHPPFHALIGIPGLDESYLPRYLGIALGTLIVINHVFSAAPATPAQLRTEALGIFLATFSIVLPYLGRFLEGAKVDRTSLPEGNRQIFLMSDNISDDLKEDLAWASYALLRSTNSISVIIAVNDVLCIRGYWNMPENEDDSRDHLFQWFGNGIQQSGFFDLKETLYFPESLGSESRIPLPKGTLSMLVQPVIRVSDGVTNSIPPLENEGFLLLASNVRYAYSKKDRAWIKAVANKFLHTSEVKNAQGFVTSP